MLLSPVPATHGRPDAGVSHISTGHASPTTDIAAPPASSWPTAARRPRGATQSHAAVMAGTTIRATPIFASKPSPTAIPARTSQRVRPSSSPRTMNQSAATQQRISSASGLLLREMATATGEVARTSPATKPATRPKRRRTRSYTSTTVATPISASGTRRLSG